MGGIVTTSEPSYLESDNLSAKDFRDGKDVAFDIFVTHLLSHKLKFEAYDLPKSINTLKTF